MASWSPENTSKRLLDYVLTATAPPASGPLELVLFSTVPTPAGAASDGMEAGDRVPITFGVSTTSTGARIMQAVSTNSQLFVDMPVASSSIVGWGLFDTLLAEIVHVNDSWTPATSFAVGDDFLVQAGEIIIYGARV